MLCQAEHDKTALSATNNKAHKSTSNRTNDATKWKLGSTPSLTLEVITGLSQGEKLKLDSSPILIGGGEDCDIYLAEPNLSQANLVAELTESASKHILEKKVRISPIHNSNSDAHYGAGKFKRSISEPVLFGAGDSFCLGGVWLRVADTTKPLASPAVMTSTGHSTTTNSASISSGSSSGSSSDNSSDKLSDRSSYESDFLRSSRKAVEQSKDNDKNFLRLAGLKAGSLVLSSVGICALTISVAQGVNKPADLSYSPHQAHQKQNYQEEKDSAAMYLAASDQEQNQNYGESLLNDIRANIESDANRNIESAANRNATNQQLNNNAKHEQLSEKEKLPYLKSIFSQMLAARELPQTVSLSHEDGSWVISGHLDKKKQRILNRMITRFKSEQGINSSITNRVKSDFSSLPFEIIQVTSGRYGNIVTQSGERLFIGDQLEGYQLVAIQDHQLVFAGKSRVTVAW